MGIPSGLAPLSPGRQARSSFSSCSLERSEMLRWFARLAVVLGLVLGPALVIHSGPAAASTVTPVPPDLVKIGEAVRHAGPGVAARNATKATSLIPGPAGLIFKTISLGTTAYQTRDYWLPFVAGALDGDPSTAVAPGPVGYVKEVTNLDGVATASTAINMGVVVTYTVAPGNTLYGTVTWECLAPSGAVTTGNVGIGYPNPNPGVTVPTDRTVVSISACSGVVGAVIKTLDVTFYPPPSYHNAGEFHYEAAITTESLDSVVTCRRPNGTTYTVTRTSTRSLTEQSEGTEWLQVAPCAEGDVAVNMEVKATTGGTTKTIGNYPLSNTDDVHDEQYPACAGVGCTYRIFVDGLACTTGVEACTHWSYIHSQQAYRVQCLYGAYQVDISHCAMMERAYDSAVGARTATQANTDGNPDTWTNPAPSPPRTSPTSSPSSSSTSSASPSPSSSASGSPVPAPSPGPGAGGAPAPGDAAGSRCWPSGWGWFNPAEWVLRPISCAFVPSPATVTSVRNSVGADIAQSGAAELVVAIQAPLTALSSGSGCSGIEFDLPINGHTFHGSILNACEEPMATAAQVSTWLISLSVIVSGGLSLLRLVGAGFGYNVKVMNDGD